MQQRNKVFEEVRFKVAQEALGGIKTGVLSRRYDVSPKTIRNWVKEYQETFGDDALPTLDERMAESKRLAELEEKYACALKALGEKELENNILRELVKKSSPASKINSTLPKRSSSRDIP
ncbi:helix-turn-helix domain-containing protein [Paenibacillus sp. HWE-109]|uniref:transposase n=1 Tax=Paenibacillus sp. HWE-109 TaxID=1306526 RepID=UPI001EE0BF97|nr:helix-turn-helix domain-containing protein [Paenibacillus sp. HWE-109]UKS25320.1 helix-turn-helix domain-containing protein [Paenibacillus sp. HWE-109]UKS25884.1 helix-turn-helix domain-containing protein [Paenibacillus sp. HWE-109]UKS28551.1 helix-turn-helix domain-containing protein [Paenibacillus sp. HWE-109]UKS28629.1 helix-turn-helix domain-containing protein [Paenibacillus sp. HWE-109]UKS28802.1 helix-turn-helix domain-containing protein [Paenibacillus sp. HWE-109]